MLNAEAEEARMNKLAWFLKSFTTTNKILYDILCFHQVHESFISNHFEEKSGQKYIYEPSNPDGKTIQSIFLFIIKNLLLQIHSNMLESKVH